MLLSTGAKLVLNVYSAVYANSH